MIPAHERRVEELFHRAVLLPESERQPWLTAHCPDIALRAEVEVLLSADGRVAERFLERSFPAADAWFEPGERLGDFTLLERLGQGGMGVVYLAREAALERKIALKIVRPDLLVFGQGRERLRREVEAVARLKHANILPVYTAGEARGVPFFTMEYVEGCTLSDVLASLNRRRPAELTAAALFRTVAELSCKTGAPAPPRRAQELGSTWTEAAFRIALAVAEALEHAHERGVLHRDVKPSNVMLTRDGRVLLLDFGLAASSLSTELSLTGFPVGTLPYMAPERLRGDAPTSGANGERGDLYALGAMLFELLTLRPPYLAPNAEVLRARILEGSPPAIRGLNPQVPWDAETVCLTAMDRDPARRYASAGALAEDLANVLEHRPIRARRPGPALRARRFVERHPVSSVAASLGCLLLAGGATFVAVQVSTNRELRAANHDKDSALQDASSANDALRRTSREKDEALGRAETANAALKTALARGDEVNAILKSMLGAPDPWRNDLIDPIARDTTVVEVLDRVRLDLASGRPIDPPVEAEVAKLLGSTYVELEMFAEADPLLVRARQVAIEQYGEESEENVRATLRLAVLRFRQRELDEAVELLEDARARAERLLPPGSKLTRVILSHLANAHSESGNEDMAVELGRRVVGMLAHPVGQEEELELAVVMTNLGSDLIGKNEVEEGAELLEQALELRERRLPAKHAHILASKNQLGFALIELGRLEEAAELLEETVPALVEVMGETNEWTLFARANLAGAYIKLGRFVEAEAQARAILARESGVRRPGHEVPIGARVCLARSLLAQGRAVEAEAFSAEAVELAAASREGFQEPAAAARRAVLAALAALEPRLVDELAALQGDHGLVHEATCAKLRELATTLRALGKTEEAALLLEEALLAWREAQPGESEVIATLERELARCRSLDSEG